jgi:hypothetical protein
MRRRKYSRYLLRVTISREMSGSSYAVNMEDLAEEVIIFRRSYSNIY